MIGRKAILVAGIALAVSTAGEARAANSVAPSPASDRDREGVELVAKERPTRRVFYGWEILASGEVGALVVAGAVMLPAKPLDSILSTGGFVVGMPTYLIAGPIVHWSHNGFTKGLLSLGGNAAFAVVGGFIGQAARCAPGDAPADCGERGFLTGLSVGALISPLVDAALLGWEYVPIEDSTSEVARTTRAPRSGSIEWAPAWTLGPRGSFSLGVAGRF